MFDVIKEFESIPVKMNKIGREMLENRESFSDGEGIDLVFTNSLCLTFFFDKKGELKTRIRNDEMTRVDSFEVAKSIAMKIYLLTRDGLQKLADDVIDYGLRREFALSKTSKLTIIPHGNEAEILFEPLTAT